MNKYEVTLRIDGNWGEKFFTTIVYAENEDEAEDLAFDCPSIAKCKYDEDGGAYEHAFVEDVILIA